MATIQDIADEVGISKAAVSRILNKKGSFSKETIEKVFQTAKKLNYILPNDIKQLEEMDFKIIAAVLPLNNIPYYSIFASYLEQAAYSFGYSLMICSSLYDKEKEEALFSLLREKRINGVIYGSFTNDVKLQEDLPIVTVGYQVSESIPVVRSDNYMAGILAAKHLLSKSCKKILYISGNQIGKEMDERYLGFQEEISKYSDIQIFSYFTGVNESKKDIPSVISQMLIEHGDADGLFAESSSLATKCLQISQEIGFNVPQDLKIVGYSNEALASLTYPKISYVKENTKQIAFDVVSTLIDIIEGNQNSIEITKIIPVSFSSNSTT
ncbi:substrate-binding domain-containing protein [Globicatella sulfidifaciens]|uniref:LacI family transcriptional regulator n=1 Tax=Globicatella sulfidifaciens TaxID=136093 RepID=A0A7X8GZE8_9LACT|nr:substrate-binding domain-containing protein [Globicatella sulfidifaciens]NLJ17593.1 LacI family transcriptional regulator [Globicatella sulfidifaciens]